MKFLPPGKVIVKEITLALITTAIAVWFAPKVSAYLERKKQGRESGIK